MIKRCLPLFAALALGAVSATSIYASAPESILVWRQNIGTERTEAGALVSPLFAAGADGEAVAFSLVAGEGGDENGRFTVVEDELQTNGSLAIGDYSVRLRAEVESGSFIEEAFEIAVVPGKVAPKAAAGESHTVVLSSDGTVFTFGTTGLGQGDTDFRYVPTPVEHEVLAGHTIVDVAAGGGHTILLSADGSVFTFGRNFYGQLGHGDWQDWLVPGLVEHENLSGHHIVDIAGGGDHTVLLSADGSAFFFGGQFYEGGAQWQFYPDPLPIEHEDLLGHTFTEVAAGGTQTVLLSADGSAFTFGSERLGGEPGPEFDPAPFEHVNLAGHAISAIAAGESHIVLLADDGTVFTYGSGNYGVLGHGDEEDRAVPTVIEAESVSGYEITGIAAGEHHTVLRAVDGTVFTFGIGLALGHGDVENVLIPTAIESETLINKTITEIAVGSRTTALLSSDGEVFTFGGGFQLGHGTRGEISVPTAIQNLNLLETSIVEARYYAELGRFRIIGVEADPELIRHGDGVENLLKYAFNLSLGSPDRRMLTVGADDLAGLPGVTLDSSGAEPQLVIEFLRRKDSGLVYTPKVSTDLSTWNVATGDATVTEINAEWERVVLEMPIESGTTKTFGSVEVAFP